MDLLFSRYASPMDFMKLYIEQGRFGEFVENIIALENERKTENAKKEDDRMLWEMYIHSMSNESVRDWKRRVLGNTDEQPQKGKSRDEDLGDSDIVNIINRTLTR